MKSLSNILENRDIKEYLKPADKKLIDEMVKLINRDRIAELRKPLPWIAVKMKVNHLQVEDLDYLLKKMRKSTYPGKTFFGALKNRA